MPIAIHEQLKVLVDLQKVDAEIFHLKEELAGHPALIKKTEESFNRKKQSLKIAEEELKGLQVKQKEKENDLLSKEDRIKKLQAQLYQLKSNKEYQTMELEIKGLKADKSLLEEEILRFFDEVESAKSRVQKEKEILAAEEKRFKEEVGVFGRRAEEIKARLIELEIERKNFTPHVEARLLSQYEKILKGREGVAIVPVERGSCGGCQMKFPPQMVNEIQMQEKLLVCESCARIVYWPS